MDAVDRAGIVRAGIGDGMLVRGRREMRRVASRRLSVARGGVSGGEGVHRLLKFTKCLHRNGTGAWWYDMACSGLNDADSGFAFTKPRFMAEAEC